MSFPASPSNGQTVTVNNIVYVYASATNTWTRSVGAGSLEINTVKTDNYQYANGNPFVSTTLANTSDITANAASGQNVGLTLSATGVVASIYGSSTSVPVVTVDSKGRITNISTSAISGSLTFTGDVTGSGSTGSSTALTLAASGVTAGNYGSATSIPTVVVDSKGRITGITTNAVSTTISLSGTSGSGSVAGGGTLTFAGSYGVTATVSSSTVTLSTSQDLRTSASPSFSQVTSTVSTGTSPFVVTSTTAVTNLNADLWDGYQFADYLNQAVKTTSSPTFAGGTFTGTVTRSSRPLITNYTGTSAPTSPVQGDEWYNSSNGAMYKYVYDGTGYAWINISSALVNSSTSATANTLALRDSNADLYATNFIGTASSAKYADLAEIYESDLSYEPGTVVVFGGTKEITATTKTHDTRVAGVISTNPAYLMNSEATGLPVAFTGRVPCKVIGPITKGDVLVASAHKGCAERMNDILYKPGCVIGKALGDVANNEITTIEVVVGRF